MKRNRSSFILHSLYKRIHQIHMDSNIKIVSVYEILFGLFHKFIELQLKSNVRFLVLATLQVFSCRTS